MKPHSTLIALTFALAACGGDAKDTDTAGATTTTDTDTTSGTTPTTPTTPTTTTPAPTMVEWLLDVERFAYVHGTYGKASYCGAFEVGAIPGFPEVRCTDATSYLFTDNGDGTLTMEEAVYVYRITTQNPDGTWPWFVDDGYSGSLVYHLTPLALPAAEATPEDAVEFEAEVVMGYGPDGYWGYLGSLGTKTKLIFARGAADDTLIDWKSADWDEETGAWVEYVHPMQDWAINVYPFGGGEPPEGVIGAFYSQACASPVPGAVISDGAGGYLDQGPGYCAPACRMETPLEPSGANGLPVCDASFQSDEPRAAGL